MKRIKLLLLLFVGNALAQTIPYNFYFLPPSDDEWTLGTPYLVWKEAGKDTMVKFSVDNRCGWYRVTFGGSPPDADAWVWLNGHKTNPDGKVGDKGLDEDPVNWNNGNPTPFNLLTRFDGHHSMYFDPQEGEKGWNNIYSGKEGKCTYKFAAIIYHTNPGNNSSFYGWNQRIVDTIVDGIVKGIVKPELKDGKMQYSETQFVNSRGQSHEWTEPNFYQAFTNTPGKNVQRCFDMPFTRRGDLWEFDALQLCPDGSADYSSTNTCGAGSGGPIGAFYAPNLMKDIDEYGDYTEQYAAMGGRGTLYNREINVKPNSCVNMWCFDRGWYGGNCTTGGTAIPEANRSNPNEVGNLDWVNSKSTKEEIDDYMKTICWQPLKSAEIGNGNSRDRGDIYDYSHPVPIAAGRTPSGTPQVANYMCFESAPATFTYTEGQEFLFRGDDDIWVFINNQLVVDVGGNHGPAPGYVKLDTIKVPEPLVPGKEYPINIFFCDRRSAGSNVRISTNMYFAQSSGLFIREGSASPTNPAKVCMTQENSGSCNSIAGGAGIGELCGNQVRDKVEYFLVNYKGEEHQDGVLWTPPNTHSPNCVLNGDILTCFGGVRIDLANGTASVDKTPGAITGISGSWTLYARVKPEIAANMNPPPERVKITSFSTQVNVRMAWGTIVDDRGTTITDVCNYSGRGSTAQEALDGKGYAVPGELFPVCFAVGAHLASGNFEVNDEGADTKFTLKLDGFKNEFGFFDDDLGLRIYEDSLGKSPVNAYQSLTIPSNGVLVLWVTGGYEQEKLTHDYIINVSGKTTEEITLHSILPRFQWIRAPGTVDSIPLCSRTTRGEGYGSKFDTDGCPVRTGLSNTDPLDYIWVGEDVKLNLRAFNEKNKNTCKTCNFNLRLKALATNPPIADMDGALINYPTPLRITNGEASFAMQGRKQVLMSDSLSPWATVILLGPKGNDAHSVTWDSLQFRKPPVPIPERTWIYDDDGDGIGDRVVIVYNRGFRRDSLPNMVEVRWDPDTAGTVRFGKATKKDKGNWSDEGIDTTENIAFWKDPNHIIKLGGLGTDINSRDKSVDSAALEQVRDTIILRGKFSVDVLTQGDGKVTSYATFKITGSQEQQTSALTGNIEERIPAIVVKGTYKPGTAKGCGGSGFPCLDVVRLEFSEPVTMDTSANRISASDTAAIKNSFAYLLSGRGKSNWDILENDPRDKSIVRFGGRGNALTPKGLNDKGDTEVEITFERWQEGGTFSQTPLADDSVKFAYMGKYMGFTKNVLMDLKGNMPNPKEIGRPIEGKNPFVEEPVKIASVDPSEKDKYIENIIERIKSRGDGKVPSGFFGKNRPVEIIPVLPSCDAKCIDSLYPGTVGILIDPDFSSSVGDLRAKYGDKVNSIKPEHITIYSSAFYHTNLGTYVADRAGFSLKCNDPIFPKSNCLAKTEDKSKLYIAWNLKDMKGRFVGAGAYVGIYDFRWEVYIPDAKETVKMDSFERKIEMHGVKRVKKK